MLVYERVMVDTFRDTVCKAAIAYRASGICHTDAQAIARAKEMATALANEGIIDPPRAWPDPTTMRTPLF